MIEKIQKKFFKFLCYKSKTIIYTSDYTYLLKHFNILSLENRRILNDCILVYKILNSKINCNNIVSMISYQVPKYNLRSNQFLNCQRVNNNVAKFATVNRIINNFNNFCNNIDPFILTQKNFKNEVISNI